MSALDTKTAMIEVRGVGKSFGSVTALREASLWANPGEVTAIVGDNGAGKSTLIKCIAGVHAPDSGEIRLDGERVHFRSPEGARAHGVETVYQDLALADDLYVWQNMFLNRELTRGIGPVRLLDRRRMQQRSRELIDSLSVSMPSIGSRVRRLSGGQRQAVAIARAVMWGSKVIIMDEPTAALGLRETAQVEKLIRTVVERGTTVLVISHNMEQVMRLAARVWVMRGGRVVGGAQTSEVTGDQLVGMITGAVPGTSAE
ncbi:ATP-binding cassette domain-containing protein [Phytohabitans kaempferiae]|uniref:ATP-binding cassette domain-containing protein n=1 Tax=Phytohabitans kaempferiae TaxID=1620943 RepID=A0ABV6LYY9_9ACTN